MLAVRGSQRPAAAQPIKVAPDAMAQALRHERRDIPYASRLTPPSEISHGTTRSSIVGPCQPRFSHTPGDVRWTVRLLASVDEMPACGSMCASSLAARAHALTSGSTLFHVARWRPQNVTVLAAV